MWVFLDCSKLKMVSKSTTTRLKLQSNSQWLNYLNIFYLFSWKNYFSCINTFLKNDKAKKRNKKTSAVYRPSRNHPHKVFDSKLLLLLLRTPGVKMCRQTPLEYQTLIIQFMKGFLGGVKMENLLEQLWSSFMGLTKVYNEEEQERNIWV